MLCKKAGLELGKVDGHRQPSEEASARIQMREDAGLDRTVW